MPCLGPAKTHWVHGGCGAEAARSGVTPPIIYPLLQAYRVLKGPGVSKGGNCGTLRIPAGKIGVHLRED